MASAKAELVVLAIFAWKILIPHTYVLIGFKSHQKLISGIVIVTILVARCCRIGQKTYFRQLERHKVFDGLASTNHVPFEGQELFLCFVENQFFHSCFDD